MATSPRMIDTTVSTWRDQPKAQLSPASSAVANALAALSAAGATPSDVVRSVIYVASGERADLSAVWQRLNDGPLAQAFTTASTLLGVAVLGFPGQLVEVDLTAALAD